MKKIELTINCTRCNGTGVLASALERNGAAIMCPQCDGTGAQNKTFERFLGRRAATGVKRVYRDNYDLVISTGKKNYGGRIVDMDTKGVAYSEFLQGEKPEHIEELACPFKARTDECFAIKGFRDECDRLDGGKLLGRWIADCHNQPNKAKCWERFHNEK